MSDNGHDTPVVRMEKMVKRFGTITALDGVDFTVGKQEVVGLLGDNGAGKSTLIKVLTGVYTPPADRYTSKASRWISRHRARPGHWVSRPATRTWLSSTR